MEAQDVSTHARILASIGSAKGGRAGAVNYPQKREAK